MNLDILIKLAEKIAKKRTDGHLSILTFTTGYKIFLGTPNLDVGEQREEIAKLKSFTKLDEALKNFIVNPIEIDNIQSSKTEEDIPVEEDIFAEYDDGLCEVGRAEVAIIIYEDR